MMQFQHHPSINLSFDGNSLLLTNDWCKRIDHDKYTALDTDPDKQCVSPESPIRRGGFFTSKIAGWGACGNGRGPVFFLSLVITGLDATDACGGRAPWTSSPVAQIC